MVIYEQIGHKFQQLKTAIYCPITNQSNRDLHGMASIIILHIICETSEIYVQLYMPSRRQNAYIQFIDIFSLSFYQLNWFSPAF